MIVKRGKGYGVSVYDPALKRKRWVGTFADESGSARGRARGVAAAAWGRSDDVW